MPASARANPAPAKAFPPLHYTIPTPVFQPKSRRCLLNPRIHLSAEMGTFSVPALWLLDDPDVSRIILHRKTGLDEMAKLARAFPMREMEAFVLNEPSCRRKRGFDGMPIKVS